VVVVCLLAVGGGKVDVAFARQVKAVVMCADQAVGVWRRGVGERKTGQRKGFAAQGAGKKGEDREGFIGKGLGFHGLLLVR